MAEGKRIAEVFGNHGSMMMGNHSISVAAQSGAEAFEELYFLERAAKTMMLAYSTGQPLNVMDEELAEKPAAGWDGVRASGFAYFDYLKSMLDRTDPPYKT